MYILLFIISALLMLLEMILFILNSKIHFIFHIVIILIAVMLIIVGIIIKKQKDKEEEIKSNLLLGDRYLKGIDVPKDINFAYNCYLKAGDLGSVEGYYRIAKMFDDGNGVKQDFEKAFITRN